MLPRIFTAEKGNGQKECNMQQTNRLSENGHPWLEQVQVATPN